MCVYMYVHICMRVYVCVCVLPSSLARKTNTPRLGPVSFRTGRVQTSAVAVKQLYTVVSTHPHTSRPRRGCLEEVKKATALLSKGMGIPPSPTWHGSGEDCLPPNSCSHSVTPHNIYLPSKWWNQVFKQWRANRAFKRKRFLARERQKRTRESRRTHLRRRKPFTLVLSEMIQRHSSLKRQQQCD